MARRNEGYDTPMIITSTRWHTEDLVGRVLNSQYKDDWVVVNLPALNEDGSLGWPGRPTLTEETIKEQRSLMSSSDFQAIYMCSPVKDSGNFFKSYWMLGYQREDLPTRNRLKTYITLDMAFSQDSGDYTVILSWAMDDYGYIYLVDMYRAQVSNLTWTDELLKRANAYKPLGIFTEAGKDYRASEPIIKKRMRETGNNYRLIPVPITTDKESRAASLQALIENGYIYFPKYLPFWKDIETEFLQFPAGKHDDVVDASSLIGLFVNGLIKGSPPPKVEEPEGHLTIEDFLPPEKAKVFKENRTLI